MKKRQGQSEDAAALRRAAEARMDAKPAATPRSPSPADPQRLVHELQVHQIELEMQNEELRRSRAEVEAGLERYTDLYDFAPVGYVSLDGGGHICVVNLAGATLLGVERSRLTGRHLSVFVAEADQSIFAALLRRVFADQAQANCEVTLLNEREAPRQVHIEATSAQEGQECRLVLVDITARQQADKALRESHHRLTQTLESISDAFFSLDRNYVVTAVNPAAERVLGKSRGELLGQNLWEQFPEAVGSRFQIEYARALADGTAAHFEEWYPPLAVWFEVDAYPSAVGLAVYFRDITPRKQVEQHRLLSLEIMGILNGSLALPDTINGILAAVKRETAFDAVGIRLREGADFPYFIQNGFSSDFLLTENTLIACDQAGGHCRDAQGDISLECPCGLVISGRIDPASSFSTKGGSFWTNDALPLLDLPAEQDARLNPRNRCIHDGYRSVALVPIRAGKEIVGLLQLNDRKKNRLTLDLVQFMEGIAASIGVAMMRKQAVDALRESEEKYRLLFDSAGDAIFIHDQQMRILAVNPPACQRLGYTHAEMLSMVVGQLDSPEETAHGPERLALLMQRDHLTFETAHRHKDGSLIPTEVNAQQITWEGQPAVLSICRDITERRRVAVELQLAKEVAEAASRAKDDFLARLSHELRAPLAPVVVALGMMVGDERLPGDVREDVAMISRNVMLETYLIDDLLDVTRITRGKLHLELRPMDLSTVLQQAAELCAAELAAKSLQFVSDPPAEPCTVLGDAPRLLQVFCNLIKNAVKFTPAGGHIAVRSSVVAGEGPEGSAGEAVVVEIRDTGIGIAPEFLSRLFDPFEQGGRQIHRQYGGLGLGLAICQSLVTAHGGSVTAASEGRSKGATFTVRLPLSHAPVAVEATVSPTVRATPAASGPLRILLVEDHADTARIMGRLLRAEGYEVETAGDIASALECAKRSSFDLLISDMGLPDGSGLDLMRQLVAAKQPLKAIAISGYGSADDIRNSREAGFMEHLVKPANLPQLLAVIERIIGRRGGGGGRAPEKSNS